MERTLAKRKDRFTPSVYGVGYLGEGEFKTGVYSEERGKWVRSKEYNLWCAMLKRAYSDKFQERNPTYKGCSVDKKWHNFQTFAKWFNDQKDKGFYQGGYQLDKDILIKGNKVYSEETCVFVPSNINSLFVKRNSERGDCLIGVTLNVKRGNKPYHSQCSNGSGKQLYKYFPTEQEAFKWYKETKELIIKQVAKEWKGKIDPRVYEALLRYEVNEYD